MKSIDRRSFLRKSVVAGGALALPTMLVPRIARSATAAFGEVDHVLVLFARGGLRSHCLFNAVGAEEHNPFGTQPAAEGTEWTLGAACGAVPISTPNGTLPSFAEITNDVTVIPCVDHRPGFSPDIDHRTATNRIATGSPEGQHGLLSLVGRHRPGYENGFSRDALPPVEIGPSELGMGAGEYAKARPLSLADAEGSFVSDLPVGKGWKQSARVALDEAFLARRAPAFDARISQLLQSKAYAREFADVLANPALDVLGQPDVEAGGFTNGALTNIFGTATLDTIGDPMPLPSWGAAVAKAVRFFQLGSPMCAVTRSYYDLHDLEEVAFAPRTQDLVRQLAGLNHVLKNMPHDKGGTFWERSLVVVISEFSRNNTNPDGFNSGRGSDHVVRRPGPARNQAVALMGGPLSKKGKRLGETDRQMNATGPVFSSQSLLSTLLDVVGVDHRPLWEDAPIQELFA